MRIHFHAIANPARRPSRETMFCLSVSSHVSDDDASASAVLNGDHFFLVTHPQMVPLSETPLLLLQSSTPIISREVCSLLSQYFDQQTIADENDSAYRLDEVEIQSAEKLLRVVHDVIDKVTNCPKQDQPVRC
jgi:hypothetical protein